VKEDITFCFAEVKRMSRGKKDISTKMEFLTKSMTFRTNGLLAKK
jgi:hypothetical protein